MASKQGGLAQTVEPQHYKKDGIEVIDFIEAIVKNLPGEEAVHVGNIVRYISRYRDKEDGAEPSTHLKKSRWYLERLIACCEAKEKSNRKEDLVK